MVLPSRRCSLESTCDDLASTLDSSEAGDRSDVEHPFLTPRSSIGKSMAKNHNKRKSVETQVWHIIINLASSFNSKGWNFVKRINLTDQSQREKSWFCDELEMRNRAQEDRAKSNQEIEELKKFCCTEAGRANQLRIDELSTREKVSKLVQIQELQGKVNSLNDTREFFGLETASSSGFSHVPSHPLCIPSPR